MGGEHKINIRDANLDSQPEILSSSVEETLQRIMGQTNNDCRSQILILTNSPRQQRSLVGAVHRRAPRANRSRSVRQHMISEFFFFGFRTLMNVAFSRLLKSSVAKRHEHSLCSTWMRCPISSGDDTQAAVRILRSTLCKGSGPT